MSVCYPKFNGLWTSTNETCDDGNIVNGDGCIVNCGAIETGWTCVNVEN
jgi:cysteine-rich repeat protein